ncbi:MAG: Uncharacterized protein Greene041679_226 [Parcubacteria group bacterium Greene0416_79]|nr:MAG: Uncharacterized protein Greene041679_226 [Parcubacteria group bacterium Greene0416_79]
MPLPFFVNGQWSMVNGLYHGGQALFISALFFLILSLTIVQGVTHPVLNRVESARGVEQSAESFYLAEGVLADVLYRLMKNMPVDDAETIALGGGSATATTTSTANGKEVTTEGNRSGYLRKGRAGLRTGSGASFHYGVQSGTGGIHLKNTSLVVGNVSANGPVTGENSNLVKGDVISAGASGLIDGVHATSSARAHTIRDAFIEGDAYYQTISNTTVQGALHPGSADQATSSLPIPDAQIEEWKSDAAAGGSAACSGGTYTVSGSVSLGPKKIPCNLTIGGSDEVTLGGHLWVEGDIEIANTASVRIDASLGEKSVAVIADKPSSETTSGKINLKNSAVFYGSGNPDSFILFISQNRSAEAGGSTVAIEVQNNAAGKLLVYAPHGEIVLKNSVSLKEVVGYKLTLENSAQVIYETGLADLLFTSGPSGGYTIDSWRE